MLIFDIGANIGKYSIANSEAEKNKLIAIEASPKTFEKLLEEVGKYNNIIPLNYAVSSSENDYVTFYHSNTANTLSTLDKNWLLSPESRFYNYCNSIEEIKIKSISIDKLINIFGIPDIIKVDVEGAEYNVIKSLSKKVNKICFEWASEWKTDIFNTLDHLNSIGYSYFDIQLKDDYIYRPSTYSMSINDVKKYIDTTTPKNEWGMIWAI
jgi:FkbM family methyltransferase